jgi:hypothetical protein
MAKWAARPGLARAHLGPTYLGPACIGPAMLASKGVLPIVPPYRPRPDLGKSYAGGVGPTAHVLGGPGRSLAH